MFFVQIYNVFLVHSYTVQPGPIHATRFSSITILFFSHPVYSWPFHTSVFLLHSRPTYSKPSRYQYNTCPRLLDIAIEHVLSRKRTQYNMFVQLYNMTTAYISRSFPQLYQQCLRYLYFVVHHKVIVYKLIKIST